MFKERRLVKRIVSAFSAAILIAGNALSALPDNAFAEESVPAAHTVNVFDIDIKQGANYYESYDVSDTMAPDSDKAVSELDDVYVWQADNANEGHKFVFNIRLSLSGIGATDINTLTGDAREKTEEAVGAGFVKISVPRHILKFNGDDAIVPDSNNVYPDELEMPVTSWDTIYSQEASASTKPAERLYYKEDPVTQEKIYDPHVFVYYLDDNGTPDDESDDKYVIFNTQPISAGEVYEFPIAYITTKNTWEYKDLDPSVDCQAELEIASWKKDVDVENKTDADSIVLTSKTPKIPVYIDTAATLKSSSKKIEFNNGIVLMNKNQLPAAARSIVNSDDDDAYKYAIWSVSSEISDVTQRYQLSLSDEYSAELDLQGTDANGNEHKAKGEIVAVNMGSGYTADKDQQGNYTVSGLTEAGRRTDYVLVRYNRQPADGYDGTDAMDDIEVNAAPAVYQTKNTSVMTLTPEDRQDKPSEISSSAIYKYEKKKPEFHPVVEKYTAAKYGLYANGLRRVGSKSNVTSYELSKLTTERSEPVSGIMYETVTSAYAYGRTVDDLTTSLKSMSVTKTADGFVVSAANREYRFVSDSDEYTVSVGGGETVTHTVPAGYFEDGNISEDDAQRIAGKDVAENYYGQKALVYTLDDNDLTLIPDVMAPSQDNKALGSSDYAINSVSYEYGFKNFSYDEYDMQFKEGVKNRDPLGGTNDVLEFYAYVDGSDVPQLVGKYDVVGLKASEVDDSLVEMLDNNKIVFKDGSKVTGYQIKTTNKYYYIELTTKPSLTVYPSTAFKAAADVLMDPPEGQANVSEKKIGVTNLAEFDIRNEDDGYINSFDIRGTDYIADIVKKSSISKKALGERTSYIGQDGNVYKSENDTLLGQYRLAWMTTMSELADGVEKPDGTIDNNVPVTQQSGVFYDLLPEHCDILEDSINVYCNAGTNINTSTASLPSSSFRLREKINNYNNSGRKLVVIEIDAPCTQSYTVTYCTIHSHDDIQDYGSTVLNTVAYQTGNPDIGDGFADDGGNYSVTMSKYIKGLDPDNGNAKRFIYAEATEDILALFPTSSGIYKKVATDSAPTFGKSGTVRNNEEYTYNIRMQNDSATRATDIAILDSIENYRTLDWESDPEKAQINKGIGKDRDWAGTLQRIDMMGLRDKVEKYLVSERTAYYYDNPAEMNFGGGTDDDRRAAAAAKAQSIVDGSGNTEYALDNVLKVMVYIGGDTQYDEDGIITYEDVVNLESTEYSDSDDRQYLLKAILDPSQMIDDEDHRALNETAKKWKTVAIDYETGKPTDSTDLAEASALIVYINDRFVLDKGDSVSFNVIMKAPDTVDSSSKLHYGDELDNGGTQPLVPHPTTYNNVYRSFRSSNTKNSQNKFTYFYTHYDYTQLSYTTVGDLSFSKVDSEEQTDRLEGVEFSLSGTSDYGTPYNITMTSDANGVVSFRNLERGRYTLIETQADADHITNTKPRIVEVDFRGRFMFVDVDGEEVQREFVYDRNGNQVFADNDPDFPLYSYTLTNERRYHGEFEFRKVNSLKGEDSEYSGAQGAVFTLEGTSDYGTTYGGEQDTEGRYTQTSGSDGTVSFGDIEAGTYTLTEIRPANGCMQPQYTKYTVKSTGSDEITFTIIPVDAGNDLLSTDKSGGYCISNTPMAELDLLKEDSVTLNPLGSAEFTLTAETGSAAARQIELTPEFYKSRGWQKTEEGWQITSEEKGPLGEYWIRYLPVGKDGKADFTLVESVAPVGHEPQWASYDVHVEPVENGEENFVITVSGCDYAQKTKSGDYSYENVTAENADFVRVLNDPSYKTKKTLIKSWVGGVPVSGNFPSLHLSSNEPDFVPKKVTISTAFKNSILTANNKRIFNGKFVQVGSSDGLTNCTATTAADGKSDDEEGQIWFKIDDDVNSPTYGSVLYYTDANVINLPLDCEGLFRDAETMEQLDLSIFRSDKVQKMKNMFNNCKKLKALDLSHFNTANVSTMDAIFQNCNALETLDISNFDTSKVSNMTAMFYNCTALKSLDVSSFNTENATTMENLFRNCQALKSVDVSSFNTSKVTNMTNLFRDCYALESLDLSNFNTAKVTSTDHMFSKCQKLSSLDISNFNTSLVTNMTYMFEDLGVNSGTTIDLSLTNFNTANVTNMEGVFFNAKGLSSVDVSSFNTSKVTNMKRMFRDCSNLTELDLSSFDTAVVSDVREMCRNASSVTKLVIGENFKLNNVGGNGTNVFYGMSNVSEFVGSSYLQMNNATQIYNMFDGFGSKVTDNQLVLDLSGMVCSKVTNAVMMLHNVGAKEIKLPNFDTSKLKDAGQMFANAQQLTSITIGPDFKMQSVTSTVHKNIGIFGNLPKLTTFNGSQYLTFDSCTDFTDCFNNCGNGVTNNTMVLDLSGISGTGATKMYAMFQKCDAKEIILSSFDSSSVTDVTNMFQESKVNKVYVSDKWTNAAITSSNNVFYSCSKIEGGNGTTWSSAHNSDKTYACIDTVTTPGYFTDIKDRPVADTTSVPQTSNTAAKNTAAAKVQASPAATSELPAYALAGRNAAGSVQLQAAGDGDEGTEVTFEDSYPPYFSKIGDVKVSNAKAGAEDGVTFGYQYDTPEDIAIPAGDEASVEVTEVITLVVKKTVDGKVYTQNYEYNGPEVKAVWKKNAGSQWECEFNVLDNTAVMYAWESDYPGYTSEQTYEHTLETQNEDADTQDPNAVISNVKEGVDVGGLIVEKQITGLLNGADPDDEFEFVVTMKNGNENYDLKPFTNGVYEFKLKNGQKKTISSIPVGCTYTVYEKNPSASQSGMFSYVSGNVSVSTPIVKNTSPTVKITNKAERTSLTLSKTAQLNKYHLTDPATAITLDSSDPDKQAWESREFSFDVSFTGLIPGEVYSYTVNGESAAFIGDTTTVSGIKLKNADTVVFNDLPVTAQYTIVEDESFVNTVSDDLKDIYTVKIGDEVSDDQTAAGTLTSTAETVHFTNIRDLTKPETVSLTVSKEWYHEGRAVQWLEYEGAPTKFSRDTNGELYVDPDKGVYIPYVTLDNGDEKYLDLDISFPSFLNVYLGYGLYDPELNNNGVLNVNDPDKNMLLLQGVDQRQTLNVKNGWSYTYKDLPKQGSIVTYETYTDDNGEEQVRKNVKYLNYVYYVTEIMPTGFKLKSEGTAVDSSLSYNANPYYTESDTSFFDRDAYFESNAYKYTGVSDTQSVALKNQTIPTRKLSVGKLANGNFGSRDKDYDFTINFVDEDGAALHNLVMTVEDLDGNIINPTRTITLDSNGSYSAAIPHNTKLIFKNVPVGTRYTITDNDKKHGYEVWSKEFDFDRDKLPELGDTMPEGYSEREIIIATMTEKDTGYLFINTLTGDVPTGIDILSGVPVMAMIMIGGWLGYSRYRRRKASAEDVAA